jgi:hypothetical protein
MGFIWQMYRVMGIVLFEPDVRTPASHIPHCKFPLQLNDTSQLPASHVLECRFDDIACRCSSLYRLMTGILYVSLPLTYISTCRRHVLGFNQSGSGNV